MGELELAIAVSGRPWADAVHRHTLDHGGARVRVRVLGASDALEQDFDVLLIDDTCSFLTERLVAELGVQGKGIVGVLDADHPIEAGEWVGRMGISATAGADAEPEAILDAAVRARRSRRATSDDAAPSAEPETRVGQLVAVMGCSGGVGATEVAVGLAGTWPRDAVLVDLDVASPSLAQRLGLKLLPNLRSALQTRRKVVDLLDGELHAYRKGLRVLPGLASPGEWGELQSREVAGLVDDLCTFGDVIVNLPAGIPAAHPHGQSLPTDTARTVLGEADVVVAVSLATPVGVSRLFEWSAAARSLGVERPAVIFNRAPRSAFARAEVGAEVTRVIDPIGVHFVPTDQRVLRAAWDGRPVRRGPFSTAIGQAARSWAAT